MNSKTKLRSMELKKLCDTEWSLLIRQIFVYKCGLCKSERDVDAHHILHRNHSIHTRHAVLNGITLCRYCHQDVHKLKKHDFSFLKSTHQLNIVGITYQDHLWFCEEQACVHNFSKSDMEEVLTSLRSLRLSLCA